MRHTTSISITIKAALSMAKNEKKNEQKENKRREKNRIKIAFEKIKFVCRLKSLYCFLALSFTLFFLFAKDHSCEFRITARKMLLCECLQKAEMRLERKANCEWYYILFSFDGSVPMPEEYSSIEMKGSFVHFFFVRCSLTATSALYYMRCAMEYGEAAR